MSEARILIVEDEGIVAKDIQASLHTLGYQVAGMVTTGEEAVELALKHKPDLVLMDVMLKGEMDGIEAAERISATTRIPVVYLTAYTDENTLRRAKNSEAFGYLLKPFEERELRTTIEMVLYKHNMERKLRESREFLETTLRCIGDAVIATDLSNFVKFINRRAEVLTGFNQSEAIGRRLADIFCLKALAGGGVPVDIDAIMAGDVDFQGGDDVVLFTRDGRQIPVDYTAAPIRESNDQTLGVVVIFRDTSDRLKSAAREHELQERLGRAKRMESLGTLAGGVAHDLNNILGPIVGYPDLIMKALPAESAIRADLDIIKNSARKAVDVVRDLLTLGRTGQLPLETLDVNQVVASSLKEAEPLLRTLEHGGMVDIISNLSTEKAMVMGSERHLRELVANLVVHAGATMPHGGRLRVTTAIERLQAPLEGYEIVPSGTYVVLHVMDTGVGFSEDDVNRMFEPFFIKKKLNLQVGTGLGLAVVYNVLKEHKAFINVRSKPGEGTDFIMYFPAAGLSVSQPTPSVLPEMRDCRGAETVLVVDDDEEQRRFAGRWLRSLGYQVLSAQNGHAALDIYANAVSSEKQIDLVVLDMIMADEFDGLETYRRILEHNPRQRAVLASGFAMTERMKEAFRLGAGQYLQKPYSLDDLGRVVRLELDKSD